MTGELNTKLKGICEKIGFEWMPIHAHCATETFLNEIISWFDENRDPQEVKERHILYFEHYNEDLQMDIFVTYYMSMYYFFTKQYKLVQTNLECCQHVIQLKYDLCKDHLYKFTRMKNHPERMVCVPPKEKSYGVFLRYIALRSYQMTLSHTSESVSDLIVGYNEAEINLAHLGDVRSIIEIVVKKLDNNEIDCFVFKDTDNSFLWEKTELEVFREMKRYFPHTIRFEYIKLMVQNIMDQYGSVLYDIYKLQEEETLPKTIEEPLCTFVWCDRL